MTTIYDSIGGAPAVTVAVDMLYDRLLADRELRGYFAASDMRRLKGHMRSFLAAALGGAEIYAGRDMAAAHAHLRITDDDFDRTCGHVVAVLAELGVDAAVIGQIAA